MSKKKEIRKLEKALQTASTAKTFTFGTPGLNRGSYVTNDELMGKRQELSVYWQLYTHHHWINRCVNSIAQAASKAYELIPADETKAAEVQGTETVPILSFLNSPNPQDSAHDLFFKIHRDLMVFGVCFMEMQCATATAAMVRPIIQKALSPYAEYITDIDQQTEDMVGQVVVPGVPIYLRVLPAQTIEVKHDDDGNILSFVQWQSNGKQVVFKPDEIVHVLHPHSQDPFYGNSPLKAIATVANNDLLIDNRQKRLLQNDLSFEMLISIPNVAEEEAKRIYEQIQAQYRQGNSDSSVIVTTAELKPENFSRSKDGDYLKQGVDNRDTICLTLGIPLGVLGLTAGVAGKGSGQDGMLRYFVEHTVRPIATKVQNILNRIVISRFQSVGADYALRIVLEDVDDQTDLINNQISAVHAGLMTVNEARAKLSMTPFPDGNDAFIVAGSTIMPLEQVMEPPEPPPAPVIMQHPAEPPVATPRVQAEATLKKAIREMRKSMEADEAC